MRCGLFGRRSEKPSQQQVRAQDNDYDDAAAAAALFADAGELRPRLCADGPQRHVRARDHADTAETADAADTLPERRAAQRRRRLPVNLDNDDYTYASLSAR